MKKQQTLHRHHRYQSHNRSNQSSPLPYTTHPVGPISLSNHKDPRSRTYNPNAKESNREQQAYKLRIVLASNTVIQILAMMVKVLNAALATLAMMTLLMHPSSTLITIDDLMLLVILLNFENQIVDRIVAGDKDIIVGHEHKQAVGYRYDGPKVWRLEGCCVGGDEDRV